MVIIGVAGRARRPTPAASPLLEVMGGTVGAARTMIPRPHHNWRGDRTKAKRKHRTGRAAAVAAEAHSGAVSVAAAVSGDISA